MSLAKIFEFFEVLAEVKVLDCCHFDTFAKMVGSITAVCCGNITGTANPATGL
jgi:hypothetical protein